MGRALGALAPIAAGAMFPGFGTAALGGMLGSGVAAGALTGAGIAALTGDDPLMGAVSGGFGGYGGGGLRGAMDATALNATAPTAAPGSFAGSPALASNVSTASTLPGAGQFTGQGLNTTTNAIGSARGGFDPTTGIGGGIGASPTISQGFQASLNDPSAFVNNLGGGSTAAGYGKLAMTAAPPILSAMEPEYESFEETEDVYDPNSQLNLNMDTGIKAALEKDSGLRLYGGGGTVSPGGGAGGVSPAMMDALNNLQMQMSSPTPIPAPPPGSIVGEKESKERMEGLLREKRLRRGYAEGGDVGVSPSGVTGAGLPSGAPVAGAMPSPMPTGIASVMPGHPMGSFDHMVSMGVHPANAAAELGLDPTPFLDLGPARPGSSPESASRRREMAVGGYLNGGGVAGDGMSDDVPAMIDGSQKAALSQGEFVLPADVVSHLGNGSSDAGSKKLYSMMDKVRKARTGNEKQGKQINPERFMPS